MKIYQRIVHYEDYISYLCRPNSVYLPDSLVKIKSERQNVWAFFVPLQRIKQ